MTASPQITFWQVANSQQKLSCVCGLVYRTFQKSQRQLIAVPNAAAAEYIDNLLWKYPKGTFIPHAISNEPMQAAIIITSTQANLNNASVLINLCPEISPLSHTMSQVHELFDKTDPAKEALSQKRLEGFTQAGFHVITDSWTH